MMTGNNLLNPKEASQYLGVKEQTLNQWRHFKIGPKYIKLGRKSVRYVQSDLESFVKQGIVEPKRNPILS
jgi:predicted DNA-binding transcriptional regulator AlpA